VPSPSDRRRRRGATGEAMAAEWYASAGYLVLDRNWRCRSGELDLVVQRGRELVFCEVKSRATDRFGTGAEAVTREKQVRIRRLASEWIAARGARPRSVRFDVASVLGDRLDVIEAAF
jgi:putative endonuclease